MTKLTTKLIIPIPTGRMEESAYKLFATQGYGSEAYEKELREIQSGKDSRKYDFEGDDAIFVRAKPADLPFIIDSGNADITAVGNDCRLEYELSNITSAGSMAGSGFKSASLNEKCGFPKTRFCVIGNPEFQRIYEEMLKDNKAITIATEFPFLAQRYFGKKYPEAVFDIKGFNGKTENAIKYWGADAIFDIVGTGKTIEENGLKIFEEAMTNPTKILASTASLRKDERVRKLAQELVPGKIV